MKKENRIIYGNYCERVTLPTAKKAYKACLEVFYVESRTGKIHEIVGGNNDIEKYYPSDKGKYYAVPGFHISFDDGSNPFIYKSDNGIKKSIKAINKWKKFYRSEDLYPICGGNYFVSTLKNENRFNPIFY